MENNITNILSKVFSEWTELRIKILCREHEIKRMQRDLNIMIICNILVMICIVLILLVRSYEMV